jgi:DNA-binding NarL/FixJ family response regulator
MLRHEKSIHIVGEAANWPQTLHICGDLMPDLLLLNIAMLDMDTIGVLPSIRRKSPDTKVLLFSRSLDEFDIFESLKMGAKGYVSLNISPSDLIKAIKTVYKGELWISRKQIAGFFETEIVTEGGQAEFRKTKEVLTPREEETLRCLTTGRSNKEIAETLFISEKTVKCHLNSIFKKLNVTRRIDATLYAINNGFT